MEIDPPRSANLPPGFDEEDPYEGKDLSEYPDWWRANIDQFRAHDMRPYRPPRFQDGELTPVVLPRLEDELGVSIQLRAINPAVQGDWGIWIDGEHVAAIGRERTGEGYTQYKIPGREFERVVRRAVRDDD